MMGLAAEDSSEDDESYANLDRATRNIKVRYRVRLSHTTNKSYIFTTIYLYPYIEVFGESNFIQTV